MAADNTGSLQWWWRGLPVDPRPAAATTDTGTETYWWRGQPMDPFPPGITTTSRSMTETVTISDSIATVASHARSMSETLTISDSITSGLGVPVSMSETVTISESISIDVPLRNLSMSETLTISESISSHRLLTRSMSETLTISDSITVTGSRHRGMSDNAFSGAGGATPVFNGVVATEIDSTSTATTWTLTLSSNMVGRALVVVMNAGSHTSGWDGGWSSIIDSHGYNYTTVAAGDPTHNVDLLSADVSDYASIRVLIPPSPLLAGDTITFTTNSSGELTNPAGFAADFSNVGEFSGYPTGGSRLMAGSFVIGSSVSTSGDTFSVGPAPAGSLIVAVASHHDSSLGGTGATPTWSAPFATMHSLITTADMDMSAAYYILPTPLEPAPSVSWTAGGDLGLDWIAFLPVGASGISDSILVHPAIHRVTLVDNAFSGSATIPAGPVGLVGTVSSPTLSNPWIDIPITTDMTGDSLMVSWTGGGQVLVVTMEDSRNGFHANPPTPGFNGGDMEIAGAFGTFAGMRVFRPAQRLLTGDYVRIRFFDVISGLPASGGNDVAALAYDWNGLVALDNHTATGQFVFGTSFAIPAPPGTAQDNEMQIAFTCDGTTGGSLTGFSNGFATLTSLGTGANTIGIGWKRAGSAGDTTTSTVTYGGSHWIAGAIVNYTAVDRPVGITDSIVTVITPGTPTPIPVPPPVPTGTRTRLPTARWRIILFDPAGNTLGYVKNPVQPKLTFSLNGIDSCSFGVYLDDKIAAALDPLVTYVKVWRSVEGEQVDPNLPIFAGKLAPMDEDGQTNLVNCTAFSPFYDLQFRYRWRVQVPGKKAGTVVWKVIQYTDTAPNIIWDLINYTNLRDAGAGDTHIVQTASPFQGTPSMIANPYVKAYDNTGIWAAIQELVTGITLADSTFGGIDLVPQYVHTEGDPTLMVLDTALARGAYQPQAGLHYRTGRKNLVNMARSFAVDTDKAATLIRATGQGGSLVTEQWADLAHGFDHDYIAREGLYESLLDLGDAVTYGILKQEALDSLKRRKPPIITVTPELSPVEPPFYGLDFGLGDVLPVASKRGRMKFQSNLRVYGAELTLSNNGNETCTLTLAEDVERVVAVPS